MQVSEFEMLDLKSPDFKSGHYLNIFKKTFFKEIKPQHFIMISR